MGRRWYIRSGCRLFAEIVHHRQLDKRSQVRGCSRASSVTGDGERTEGRSNEERNFDDQTLLLLSWPYYHCHCTWYPNVPKNQRTKASSWLLVCLMFG